jgi:hypothetical protein
VIVLAQKIALRILIRMDTHRGCRSGSSCKKIHLNFEKRPIENALFGSICVLQKLQGHVQPQVLNFFNQCWKAKTNFSEKEKND